jgi:hypothetical protein
MLTAKQPHSQPANSILAFLSNGVQPQALRAGVFLIGHFNGDEILPGKWERWPELSGFADDNRTNCHGVCDDVQQLLDRCPMLMNDPDREFAITLTEVRRDEQPASGGWRWHKWGPYIGIHDPQHEYLYHEAGIERVFCYHVYELRS